MISSNQYGPTSCPEDEGNTYFNTANLVCLSKLGIMPEDHKCLPDTILLPETLVEMDEVLRQSDFYGPRAWQMSKFGMAKEGMSLASPGCTYRMCMENCIGKLAS